MNAEILNKIIGSNLPIRVVGNGEITHTIVGKMTDSKGVESEVVCLIAEFRRPASEKFKSILASQFCQCGRQKLENFALCGGCYSKLRPGLKQAFLRNKGGQLEGVYKVAVEVLQEEGKINAKRK